MTKRKQKKNHKKAATARSKSTTDILKVKAASNTKQAVTPSEIHSTFVEPLRESLADQDDADMRHQLAYHILATEKACILLDAKACKQENNHCIWAPRDNGLISKILRGKACRGKRLHAWNITMPPAKSDLTRINKRYEALLQKKEQMQLSDQEEEELGLFQAMSYEVAQEAKKALVWERELRGYKKEMQLTQRLLKKCEENPDKCSSARRVELENRLLSLQHSRVKIVGGFRQWLRDMSPYILAFVLIVATWGAFTVGANSMMVNLTQMATSVFKEAGHTIAQGDKILQTGLSFTKPVTYAAMGAAAGSAIPVIGTAIGGTIGFAIGILESDPRLKEKIVKLPSSKNDICWPLPRYRWHWSRRATTLYGLMGPESGVLSVHVRQLFPNLVQKDAHGFDRVDWPELLLTSLPAFRRQRRKVIPHWSRVKGEAKEDHLG